MIILTKRVGHVYPDRIEGIWRATQFVIVIFRFFLSDWFFYFYGRRFVLSSYIYIHSKWQSI